MPLYEVGTLQISDSWYKPGLDINDENMLSYIFLFLVSVKMTKCDFPLEVNWDHIRG